MVSKPAVKTSAYVDQIKLLQKTIYDDIHPFNEPSHKKLCCILPLNSNSFT